MSLGIGSAPNNILFVNNGDGQGSNGTNPRQVINTAAASYLGISAQTLQQDLAAGQSLAQIAQAQGKSVDGLKSALTSALTSALGTTDSTGAAGGTGANSATGIANLVNRVVNAHHTGHGHKAGGDGDSSGTGAASVQQQLASFLGISTDQLNQQLSTGQSLSAIAQSQGKDPQALQQTLLSALNAAGVPQSGNLAQSIAKLVSTPGVPQAVSVIA